MRVRESPSRPEPVNENCDECGSPAPLTVAYRAVITTPTAVLNVLACDRDCFVACCLQLRRAPTPAPGAGPDELLGFAPPDPANLSADLDAERSEKDAITGR